MKNHPLRWCALFLFLAITGQTVFADEQSASPAPAPISQTNAPRVTLSANTGRAAWQEHLTLGPGDVLNFALYSDDALTQIRENVVIGPDGRVSYLQALDIPAAGLTIDELRARMNEILGKIYNAPHTVITPVTIISKKYVILGSVVNKGVFTLDRPMTLIEAIARAGGLETGVFEHNTVEVADLSHSFLVRHGQRMQLDFEKLFQQGDLSQNIPLEPDDYLYFASSSANEVYVLGEVALPGTVPFNPSSSVIGAITTRGGFTPKAFKGRVLVIRGSLTNPETFVVDTADILEARTTNFRLKPRDIVYVAPRPWHRVEELLDEGTRAFIEAVTVTYTGAKIGPFISPIIK
jgi:protein involved in polysaccharide export with SLBB domain